MGGVRLRICLVPQKAARCATRQCNEAGALWRMHAWQGACKRELQWQQTTRVVIVLIALAQGKQSWHAPPPPPYPAWSCCCCNCTESCTCDMPHGQGDA